MDQRVTPWWFRAPASLGIGLVAVPIAKLLWIPNYIFNFLTTLVHEVGHSVCAWLMGRPSIPTVSVAGGGVTVWGDQNWGVVLAIVAALAFCGWRFRPLRWVLWPAAVVQLILAFTIEQVFVLFGGVLLEVVGAGVCFAIVTGVHLSRSFERPLYALWGWWMLVNRGWETILMLRSPAYRQAQAIIQSGLAAGLTTDLERVRATMGTDAETVLWLVLALCVLALPVGAFVGYLVRREE